MQSPMVLATIGDCIFISYLRNMDSTAVFMEKAQTLIGQYVNTYG